MKGRLHQPWRAPTNHTIAEGLEQNTQDGMIYSKDLFSSHLYYIYWASTDERRTEAENLSLAQKPNTRPVIQLHSNTLWFNMQVLFSSGAPEWFTAPPYGVSESKLSPPCTFKPASSPMWTNDPKENLLNNAWIIEIIPTELQRHCWLQTS